MTAQIIAACRSPVAPRDGALAALDIHELGAPVVRAALAQAGILADQVDELIVSNALGAGGNPARHVALAAGLPERVAGLTLDRQCAGGMDAILLAMMMVQSGAAKVVVAGGVESYSRRPLRARTFADGRPLEPYDQARFTPWPERDPDMSAAAAALGSKLGIGRTDQDTWAIQSHAKARAHVSSPNEIVPIANLTKDAFTRRLSAKLCERAPVIIGDITAANAAVAADGAAFCVVVAPELAKGCRAVRIVGGATLGDAPDCPGLAPVAAIHNALARHNLQPDDFSNVEIMEAYAVQAIACVQGASLDPARVNLGGGGLARGHPIGASGAINTVRLFHSLLGSGGTGLAAIAAAGGIGTALILDAG
jgi:acetyl-CoA C-acetyltransferase